jgi:adenine-specific DNA-methyltransferase
MNKLKMHSPNLTQDNIVRIRDLFPGCVTEAKGEDGSVKLAVDFDQLRQELADSIVEGPQERYHLNWPGKREALLTANAPIAKTLRPCRDESVDFDSTKNLFIEGDNLDALKLLQETYLGKVKMIYIDPPYNTGNDFIYADDFCETSDEFYRRSMQKDEAGNRLIANLDGSGKFHSRWMSMIYSRIKLARNFLSDDGVFFVSIDDGESDNLRKICSEIFGESNFIGTFTIISTPNARDYGHIGKMHEYVHFYAKNIELTRTNQLRVKDKNFKFKDDTGGFNIHPLYNSNEAFTPANRPNLYFPIYLHPEKSIGECFFEIDFNNSPGAVEIYPPKSEKNSVQFVWRWGREKCEANFNKEIIGYKTEGGAFRIVQKMRHTTKVIRSLQDDTAVSTRRGTAEVEELLGGKFASFPKPLQLLRNLIEVGTDEDSIVMDFFAGSCTTAEAVMSLNALDGGKRRFILVQISEGLPDNSEALKAGYEDLAQLGAERIRRAGTRIGSDLANPKIDTGFRVLKIDNSNMADVYYAPDALDKAKFDLFVDNIKPDRTPEDLLFQVMLDWGVDLALPITKHSIQGKDVFFVDGNALAACFDASGSIDEAFVKELAKHQPLRVVFRDAGYKDSAVKINVEQIFKLLSPATEVKCI